MTEDGVGAGGLPGVPEPGDSQQPDVAPNATRWQPTDWLAPAPAVEPAAPAEPAPAVEPAPAAEPAAPAEPEPAPFGSPAAVVAPAEPLSPAPLADATSSDGSVADEPLAKERPEDAEPHETRPRLSLAEYLDSLAERLRRTPPALVILTLATVGSTGFLAYELASRTAPIALLSSAAAVTGLCYVATTIVCALAAYRAGSEGRTWRALLLAFIGGSAAIVAAMSFAAGLVLVLALGL